MDVYKNIVCLDKEGYSRHFDFSKTLENLRGRLFDSNSFHSILWSMSHYSFTVNKTFNFSITLKDIELLEHIKYPRNTFNKINTVQIFKSNECVICLTNQPNVLFCNCGHIAICEECDRVKSLEICPVCKTENTIKRTIKY